MRGRTRGTLEGRFWSKVDKTEDCWLWTGRPDRDGYGRLRYHDGDRWTTRQSHRISYEIHVGLVPPGLCVLHHCDNPPCVNPDHLHLGTIADNNNECKQRGRTACGDKNGSRTCPGSMPRGDAHWMRRTPWRVPRGSLRANSKLDESSVAMIRAACKLGAKRKDLAARFGVCPSTITWITTGKMWKHVVSS